jgi:RNA polymerase sigma-70 factor, ECF subfamily
VTVNEQAWQLKQFERQRSHLQAVAYRMLGSLSEADDALQEARLRLCRADTEGVSNLGGWLTTVVGRICLDMLRSRRSCQEDYGGSWLPEPIVSPRSLARMDRRACVGSGRGERGLARKARGADFGAVAADL